MRIEDLMINDWVFNTHNNKPEQVQEILTVSNCDDGNSVMLDYNDIYNEDDIEPIPLTTEILEKNGFKKENGGKIMGFNIADSYKLVYQGRTNFDKFWINIQDFGESKKWYIKINGHFDISGYINDVHELQHALKLCGIDKQIVL